MAIISFLANENFPEAAAKHLEDAKTLFIYNRIDGAAYLIGYTYECILKTFLVAEGHRGKSIHKHDLSLLASKLASVGNPQTAKYCNAFQFNKMQYGAQGWSETMRYHSEGQMTEVEVDHWIVDAENFFDRSIRLMKLDGLI